MTTTQRYAIALTAALGLFMAVLDNTIVNVALFPMAQTLGSDLGSIQWVVTAYFLAQAAVIPIAGYFSGRYGQRRIFLICLAFFTLGSLLCGLAQDATSLILFRVVQGLGGGALFPVAQALAFGAFDDEQRGASSALVGVPVLLAPAFGPTLGGWLTDSYGWASIFLINIPVGLLALALGWRIIPNDTPDSATTQKRFDVVGLSLSILGVLAVVYAFTLVSEPRPGSVTAANPRGELHGWLDPQVLAFGAAGLVLLAAFAVHALHFSRDPVLDLRLFSRYNFLIGSLVSWCSAILVFGSIFLLPVFFQQVRLPHMSALEAGLALMPQGLASAVAVALTGPLYNRLGVRLLASVGAVLLIVSSFGLSYLTPSTDGWQMLPWLLLRGFGFGLTVVTIQAKAIEGISGVDLAKASSLFSVTRQIASSIGLAILVTLFVQRSAFHAGALQGQLADPALLAAQAGTAAMNDVFTIVTLGCVVMLALSLAIPGRPKTGVIKPVDMRTAGAE